MMKLDENKIILKEKEQALYACVFEKYSSSDTFGLETKYDILIGNDLKGIKRKEYVRLFGILDSSNDNTSDVLFILRKSFIELSYLFISDCLDQENDAADRILHYADCFYNKVYSIHLKDTHSFQKVIK